MTADTLGATAPAAAQVDGQAEKRIATATAKLALAGATLQRLPRLAFEPPCFVVGWRGVTRCFDSLEQVEILAENLSGTRRRP